MSFKGGGGAFKPKKKVPASRVKKSRPLSSLPSPTRPIQLAPTAKKAVPPSKPKAAPAKPTPAPRTDAQSSGPDYGTKKATAFRQTKPYAKAVDAAQRAQPANVRYHRAQVALARVTTPDSGNRPTADIADGKGRYIGGTELADTMALRRRMKNEAKWASAPTTVHKPTKKDPGWYTVGPSPHKELKRLSPAEEKKVQPAAMVYHKKSGGGGFGLAALNPTAAAALASKGIDKALTGTAAIPGTNTKLRRPLEKSTKVVGNAFKDAINIPAEAVPTAYYEGRKLAKGDVKGVAKDLVQPYKDLAKHPLKTAEEHPLQTYLMLAGVKGGVGRSVGRVGRTGALGKPIKAVTSTEREAATVPGTTLKEKRTYSPDVTVKARQVVQEKAAVRKTRKLKAKADAAYRAGDDEKGDTLTVRAAQKDPTRMKEKQIRRRIDELSDANEIDRRRSRAEVTSAVDKAVPRKASAHVSLTAQAITHASKEDLRNYHNELVEESKTLVGSRLAANRRLRKQVKKAFESKETPAQVESAVKKLKDVVRPDQEALAREGIVPREQGDRSALIPYAVRRMRAAHGKPETTADVVAARKDLNAAVAERARVERAHKSQIATASRSQGRAEVLVGQADRRRERILAKPTRKGKVTKAKLAAKKEMGRAPKRSLAALERERGKLAHIEGAPVRKARQGVRDAELQLKAVKQEAKAQRSRPAQVLDSEGRQLSTEQIRAHMKANGVDEPIYLNQAPKARNGYFVAQHEPQSVSGAKRTGEATRKGTFSADRETVRESAARTRGLVDAHKAYARFVGEFALRKQEASRAGERPDVADFRDRRRALAAEEARQHTKDGRRTGADEMVPVNLGAFGGKQEQLQALLDRANGKSEDVDVQPIVEALHEALDGRGPGRVALVPKAAVDQMRLHVNRMAPSDGMRAMQATGGAFRGAVLATNPRWLVGNTVEASLRAGVSRSGPRSVATYIKTRNKLRKTDPEAARMLEARVTSGGMFHAQDRLPHRAGDQFANGTALGKTARAVSKALETPGPKQVVQAWHAWSHLVFDIINKPAETLGQYAMAGKAIRANGLMDGNVLKLSNKAIDQAARGLRNTEEQVALGRAVDDMYGKYNKYSPGMKQTVQLYTPFIAWSLNAVNFLTRVMPRDHPVLTGLIASATQASEEWRNDHGLDMWMGGKAPLWLQGAIPLSDGGWQRAPNRYTPFAVASDPGGTIADNILPQFSSALNALHGRDWTGKELPGGGDDISENAKAATLALMQSMIPIYSTAKNIKDKGANAALNPIYPVKPKAAKGPTIRKSALSTGGGWGRSQSSGSGGWGSSSSSSSSNGGWG